MTVPAVVAGVGVWVEVRRRAERGGDMEAVWEAERMEEACRRLCTRGVVGALSAATGAPRRVSSLEEALVRCERVAGHAPAAFRMRVVTGRR